MSTKTNYSILSRATIPATAGNISQPNLGGNVLLESLSRQKELENHCQTFHTWPSEPVQFPQTKQAATDKIYNFEGKYEAI